MPMRMRTSIGSTPFADEIHILGVQRDAARVARGGLQIVHAVEAAQERALATTRRPDQRSDLVVRDRNVQVLERVVLTVPEIQFFGCRLGVERAHLARVVDCDRDARRTGIRTVLRRRWPIVIAHGILLIGLARDACSWIHTSPVDLLAETVADLDRDGVHQQRHAEQDRARRGGIGLECLVRARYPVEHLDRHGRERRCAAIRDERKFAGHRRIAAGMR